MEVERREDAMLRGVVSLSSTSLIWDGWLILDRVIDAPVYQAILTWNGSRAE